MDGFHIWVYIMTFSDNSRSWVYNTVHESVVSPIAPPVRLRCCYGGCYHSTYTLRWQIEHVLGRLYEYGRLAPDESHQDIVQLDVYRIHRYPFYVL